MIAGCSISDSTPPRLSAHANSATRSSMRTRRALAAAHDEGDHAAGQRHLARARARAAGCERKPGVEHALDRGVALEPARERARRSRALRRMRSGSVLSPRSTRKQSNGEGTAPTAFWRKRRRSRERVVARDDRAADHVGVAVQVLGRRVHDQIGAELERALQHRRRERVVDRAAARRACARRAPARAMSTILSSGLVGVSTQIKRVFGRSARCTRVAVGHVDAVDREAESARTACRGCGTCRRRRRRTRPRDRPGAAAAAPPSSPRSPRRTRGRAARPRARPGSASSARRVGLSVREYSKPLCLPGPSCANVVERWIGVITAPVSGVGLLAGVDRERVDCVLRSDLRRLGIEARTAHVNELTGFRRQRPRRRRARLSKN